MFIKLAARILSSIKSRAEVNDMKDIAGKACLK